MLWKGEENTIFRAEYDKKGVKHITNTKTVFSHNFLSIFNIVRIVFFDNFYDNIQSVIFVSFNIVIINGITF